MIKILFVCHGNICRSPMAEYIMKDLIRKKRLSPDFCVESAATSSEETGRDIYPPVRELLLRKGIPFKRRAARKMRRSDYQTFDYIFYMDQENLRGIRRIILKDPEQKIKPLLEDGDVADPWYTEDFEAAWEDILRGCQARLEEICRETKVHVQNSDALHAYSTM